MVYIRHLQKNSPHHFWVGVFLVLILPVAYFLLTALYRAETSRVIISDIFSPGINILATIILILAAYDTKKVSARLAAGWGVVAAAQLSFTLGDLTWSYLELVLKSPTFPSIADGLYLLFYPLFLVGISFFISRKQNAIEWIKKAIDISIILVVSSLSYWIFLIAPIVHSSAAIPTMEKILTVAYPAGDLILLFALLIILYHRSVDINPVPLWILALGTVVMILADSIYSHQALMETYVTGSLLDFGWILSYILFALAGIAQSISVRYYRTEDTLPLQVVLIVRKLSRVFGYVPYLWVVAAYLLLYFYKHEQYSVNEELLFLVVGYVFAIVIIRQLMVINENSSLLGSLRLALNRVEHQAKELDQRNLALQEEIIERQRIQRQLAYDAIHDSLTGLANRILLMDRLEHALAIVKRGVAYSFSILFLDIDNFKLINDRFGHTIGDAVLCEIGQRIKQCTREMDTVVRFGGDEFIILLENTSDHHQSAILVAERVLKTVSQSIYIKGFELQLTCSVGILQGLSGYSNPEDILRDVDIALHQAKSNGKFRYEIFNESLGDYVLSRFEMENDLRHAISNRELFLQYQPIYVLESHTIAGFEALVRWLHPKKGLLMPSAFIQVAEETGLIVELGDWVLLEASEQMKKWHAEYPHMGHLSISVNVSAKQISQMDFIDKVKRTLQVTGLKPSALHLEITETVMIGNLELVNELVSSLRDLGVKVLMDDFGTGYSSLRSVGNLTVDILKIDKSFIDDMLHGQRGYEIIKAITHLAHGMGIDTVAEGIEQKEQLEKLVSLNCKYGQGYLFSRPLDSARAAQLIHKQADQVEINQ